MPLTDKGKTILASMEHTYGSEKEAKSVLYASKNAGKISGIDAASLTTDARRRFTTAVRDCKGKGMSFDAMLSHGIKHTKDVDEENLEGAQNLGNAAMGAAKGIGGALMGDSLKRFRKAFKDAVRENLPIQKCLELGVISGVAKPESTPESVGKAVSSQDRAMFRDAIRKGATIASALKVIKK